MPEATESATSATPEATPEQGSLLTETTDTAAADTAAADTAAADTAAADSASETVAETDDGEGAEVRIDIQKKADTAKAILGKFKDQAALEKAYSELETKLKTKTPLAPESYDLVEPMKAAGWEPLDPATNKEAYDGFAAQLKEQGFSQKQAEWMFQFGKGIIDEQIKQLGPATDRDAELAAVKKEWGDDFEPRLAEISKWARATINADVLNKPLASTKEGLLFLASVYAKSKGPSPITDGERAPAFDPQDAQIAVKGYMDNEDYWKENPAGRALRAKVLGIQEKLTKKK